MATATKSYTVTDKAGRYLLGRRVKAGDIVMLTENQAAYELARGIVEDPNAPKPEHSEAKEVAAASAADLGRPVAAGEVLEPGQHVTMDLATGQSFVKPVADPAKPA